MLMVSEQGRVDFLAECDAALDEEIDSLNLRLRGVYAGGEKSDNKEKKINGAHPSPVGGAA